MFIDIVKDDILSVASDVAVFKYASRHHGADLALANAIGGIGDPP